ncbi:hypothetical protein C7121_15995 [Paenibacillus glucanolyticus]|jgi:hypothetical protein|nr:hypothetical protein C7121_15995 [Paenibacillus glucanolyticus]AWP26669.1 hypothetical protein B9D94_08580 [Paenibacillus sp. Cedars]MPY16996.1 hypothetical protein [Paenibacillus glucanolyticus]OMF80856.1 hypothetical protein BK142_05450 [Paenibacillus glucanolyticus]
MASVNAVPQPDLVLINWSRNPLVVGSPRRILAARVIGSSSPCRADLTPNALLSTALACLLDNDVGFKIVFRKRTSNISGYLLLQRV